ncbi:MAG: ribbon-helix-helix domain-containing protein [Candidatus Parvarchaeota archaeon]|nr:ribbon-helix-helix domain-containing protein [Candidatus Parvarchaeota archaeon]MCW1301528.1 ribbon-helix-helix domain-containing protein [Candidatus Parvarchaeota archaeon]
MERKGAGYNSSKKFTTVSLPKPLAVKLNKIISGTGFTSLSSFVEYVMREIVVNEMEGSKGKNVDVSDVEEKLRRLGYL